MNNIRAFKDWPSAYTRGWAFSFVCYQGQAEGYFSIYYLLKLFMIVASCKTGNEERGAKGGKNTRYAWSEP